MLLLALAGSLAVGAVLICIAIISGTNPGRVVLADYAFIGFSLLGLTSTAGKQRPWSPFVGAAGIGASVVGLIVSIIVILTPHVTKGMVQLVGVTIVVPILIAYTAVILLAYGKVMAVNVAAASSVGLGAIFATFAITQILAASNLGTAAYKAWAIVGIFTALGTVVTPILSQALTDN